MTTTDYIPVDCDLHSGYELAVMRHTSLRLRWYDDARQQCSGILRPLELATRNHEEFLIAEDRNRKRIEIRLDRIISSEVVDDATS